MSLKGCRFVILFLLLLAVHNGRAATQPNIVLFFIDDMGWRDWSGSGNTYLQTPSIDRIAARGVVFEQGYVNAANCAPSRCALLSGQYSTRTHFYNVWSVDRGHPELDRLSLNDVTDGQVFADEKTSFAEALKLAGYKTAMYGKWHVSGHGRDGSGNKGGVSPRMQGFDAVLEHPSKELGAMFKATGDPKNIFLYTKRAMDFAEQCTAENKPFMIYMAHHAVHVGSVSLPESRELYTRKAPSGPIDNAPPYAAMMHDTDTSIGMMLDKLKALGIEDHTVVMLLSDNGGVPGNCTQPPLRAYKGSYYEGGIRVPFMISWPGRIKPGRNTDPVMAIDLYPTMLEMAGVKDIQSHLGDYVIDGTSLMPALDGGALKERSLFWHCPAYLPGSAKYTGTRSPDYRLQPVSVIRKGDWKLHLFMEEWSLDGGRDRLETNHAVELYNVKEDIGEQHDLALTHPAKRNELLDELLAWHRETNAEIPREPNPRLGLKPEGKRKKDKKKTATDAPPR